MKKVCSGIRRASIFIFSLSFLFLSAFSLTALAQSSEEDAVKEVCKNFLNAFYQHNKEAFLKETSPGFSFFPKPNILITTEGERTFERFFSRRQENLIFLSYEVSDEHFKQVAIKDMSAEVSIVLPVSIMNLTSAEVRESGYQFSIFLNKEGGQWKISKALLAPGIGGDQGSPKGSQR